MNEQLKLNLSKCQRTQMKRHHQNFWMAFVVDFHRCLLCWNLHILKMPVWFTLFSFAFWLGKLQTKFFFANNFLLEDNFLSFEIESLNTFRLWVVQLFAIMKEFEMELPSGGMSSDANLCKMIQFKVNKTEHIIINAESTYDCEPVSSFFFENYFLLYCNAINWVNSWICELIAILLNWIEFSIRGRKYATKLYAAYWRVPVIDLKQLHFR